MDIFGWVLFLFGSLVLLIFAVVGFDAGLGEIGVTNLAGDFVGTALMISGAIFVGIGRIENALKGTSSNSNVANKYIPNNPYVSNSFAKSTVSSTASAPKDVRRIKVYKGKEILKTDRGVMVDEEIFANVIEAEKWIDTDLASRAKWIAERATRSPK